MSRNKEITKDTAKTKRTMPGVNEQKELAFWDDEENAKILTKTYFKREKGKSQINKIIGKMVS